ncbi:unnamed protein product [Caenorhabditis brenneri]
MDFDSLQCHPEDYERFEQIHNAMFLIVSTIWVLWMYFRGGHEVEVVEEVNMERAERFVADARRVKKSKKSTAKKGKKNGGRKKNKF